MKLKTQLIITLSIFILISVIIISAIIIANEKLQNTNRNEKLIIDIESGYFELSHLESDYLINKGDREIEQWRSKYAIISDQIDELQLEDLDEKSLSANMKAGHVQLEPLFSDFISDKNSAGSTGPGSSRDERQGFRWSSLAMQTEKVTYDANELMRLLRADATATLEWFNVIILLSIGMLLVSSVISYALITRSVIESLSRLRSGIEQVGSGELDARVDTGTDDELGDLALLFNEMADKLKMVMARKSELEKEVAERKRVEEQLKESETRYREFFTTSRDSVFITSPDGRMIDFNDATLEMFGYDNREEMSNVSIPSLYAHSEDRSVFLNLIVRDGYVKEFPVQLKRRDGTVIDSLITGVPLRNPDGTIKALIGTARDITERKMAEAALEKSKEFLNKIINSIGDPIHVKDRQHRVILINDAACRLFNLSREEIIGKTAHELFPKKEMADLSSQKDEEVFRTGEESVNEETNTYAPGKILTVLVKKTLYTDTAGNQFLVGITTDITERKQLEERLAGMARFNEGVIGNANVWLTVLDTTGKIFVWNRAAETISGYRADEVIGKKYIWRALYPDKNYRRKITGTITRIIAEKNYLENFESEIRTKDGGTRIMSWNTRGMTDAGGKDERYIAIGLDITERKRVEEEIRLLNATLEQRVHDRTQELEQATETIRASLEEKIVLLREVHHRVKNNLQILISLLNMQSRTITDPQVTAALKESTQRIRAMSMVHEKLHSGSDLAHIEFVSYLSWLANSQVSFYQLDPGKVTIETKGENILLDINTAIPLGLVMNELVSNALKHAFPGDRKGTIRIDAREKANRLEITFSDNGIGIPEGFDWKTAPSLGLQLVTILIDQLSGTIELDRTAGTTFTIVVKEKE